jgi:hypothetical protein
MSNIQENIKTELKKKYSLNREPHWYTECIKWAEKTREYINKGLNDEEAGSRAAEDILTTRVINRRMLCNFLKRFICSKIVCVESSFFKIHVFF